VNLKNGLLSICKITRKWPLKFCFFASSTAFAGAALKENKTRFATDSVGWKQKRQRIGSPAPAQGAKCEMR
jgi:hypothetical protein